jgi:hypothetical protein
MEADRKATGWIGAFEIASDPADRVDVQAIGPLWWTASEFGWTPPADLRASMNAVRLRGQPLAWHAELRSDRTGWRLWSVTIPPWCCGYSRCGRTPASPDSTPT